MEDKDFLSKIVQKTKLEQPSYNFSEKVMNQCVEMKKPFFEWLREWNENLLLSLTIRFVNYTKMTIENFKLETN
jgi:hypothetical protein